MLLPCSNISLTLSSNSNEHLYKIRSRLRKEHLPLQQLLLLIMFACSWRTNQQSLWNFSTKSTKFFGSFKNSTTSSSCFLNPATSLSNSSLFALVSLLIYQSRHHLCLLAFDYKNIRPTRSNIGNQDAGYPSVRAFLFKGSDNANTFV